MKKNKFKKLTLASKSQFFAALIVIVGVAGILGFSISQSHAATPGGTLYISPPSGSYSVGNTITFEIRENSEGNSANAVEADINFPASLTYSSYSIAGSNFNYPGPSPTITSNEFELPMFSTTALTGDELVGSVSFIVNSDTPASAVLSFASSSLVANAGVNNNATTTGATYTLTAATCPAGKTGTPPNCIVPTCPTGQIGTPPNCMTPTPPKAPAPTPAPKSGGTSGDGSGSSTGTGTNVTPSGSSTPVTIPNQSSVQVSAPASVTPESATSDEAVLKVEYYLNTKLLATVTTAPYTYKLNTTDILNGTYTFTTKTYYSSGKTTSTTQKFIVKNPRSFTQVRLAAQQYAGPAVSVLILFAIGFVLLFRGHDFARAINKLIAKIHHNDPPSAGGTPVNDDNNPVTTPPTVVSPTVTVAVGPVGPTSFVPNSPQSQSPGAIYVPNAPSDPDNRL